MEIELCVECFLGSGFCFKRCSWSIELVFDKFMKGKWRTIGFDLGPRHFVKDIGTSPEHLLGMYGKLKKLSSSQKNAIKKILKNPEDIDMIKRDGQNVNKVLKVLK